MSRDTYKIYDENYPYFITLTIVGWLPLFSNPKITEIIVDSLKYRQNIAKEFKIYAYVIMENHLHLILKGDNLVKSITSFKSFTGKKVIEFYKEKNYLEALANLEFYKKKYKLKQDYQFWQDGYHPIQITSRKIMKQKIEYIHNNPVKRGYVREPAQMSRRGSSLWLPK